MTESRKRMHLAEKIAQRLRETDDPGAPFLVLAPENEITPSESAVSKAEANERAGPDATRESGSGEQALSQDRLTIEMLERAGMVISRRQRNRISEEFRIASQQVRQTLAKADGRPIVGGHIVMVTSARPREGKSFAALNLASSLALDGEGPVLLVDGSTDPNSLSHLLGFTAEPGLLDFGVAPSQLANTVTIPSRIENLSFLPIGGVTAAEGSSQLAAQQSIARTVEKLAQRFADSIIVIDVPPCLTSSDAATLASLVGQIVVVVEAERTQRSEVEAALDLIDDCPNINLLLNKAKLMTSDTFGAYT